MGKAQVKSVNFFVFRSPSCRRRSELGNETKNGNQRGGSTDHGEADDMKTEALLAAISAAEQSKPDVCVS